MREGNAPRSGSYVMQQQTSVEQLDLGAMVADLNSLLRLKTPGIGMKLFARVEDMLAVPKIRRPSAVHTTDQIVSMASRLGWAGGVTGGAPRGGALPGGVWA